MTNVDVLGGPSIRIALATVVYGVGEAASRYLRDDDIVAKLSVGFLKKWCDSGKNEKLLAINNTLKAELDRAATDHVRWFDATGTVERDKKTGKRLDGNGPLYRFHVILSLYNLVRFCAGSGEVTDLLTAVDALDEIPLNVHDDIDDPSDERPKSFTDMLEATSGVMSRAALNELV